MILFTFKLFTNENYFDSLVIHYLIFTEKSISLLEQNKYAFDISNNITKKQIRLFFSRYYSIHLTKINTYILARKKRRVLTSKGYKKNKKRVIISLQSNQSLPSEFYSR
jgi:large subunit ribosomal protein L23